jgi:hypothetical protein
VLLRLVGTAQQRLEVFVQVGLFRIQEGLFGEL